MQHHSFFFQVLMCSSFGAYDGGLVFMQLTMMPCLQLLGVPVVLVTVSGIMSGSLTLLLLPGLGWLSDSGKNPHRRKQVQSVGVVCVLCVHVFEFDFEFLSSFKFQVSCVRSNEPCILCVV
jgi:hypothetical protein